MQEVTQAAGQQFYREFEVAAAPASEKERKLKLRAARLVERRATVPTVGIPRAFSEDVTAAALDVSVRTLQGWRAKGKGPKFVKLGRGLRSKVVYSAQAIEQFIAENSYQSTTEAQAAAKDAPKATRGRGRR